MQWPTWSSGYFGDADLRLDSLGERPTPSHPTPHLLLEGGGSWERSRSTSQKSLPSVWVSCSSYRPPGKPDICCGGKPCLLSAELATCEVAHNQGRSCLPMDHPPCETQGQGVKDRMKGWVSWGPRTSRSQISLSLGRPSCLGVSS